MTKLGRLFRQNWQFINVIIIFFQVLQNKSHMTIETSNYFLHTLVNRALKLANMSNLARDTSSEKNNCQNLPDGENKSS